MIQCIIKIYKVKIKDVSYDAVDWSVFYLYMVATPLLQR